MGNKRKRDSSADLEHRSRADDSKRRKRGFVVGPANLPDGSYKRKTQKIKSALIARAKIKKDYAKLKRQGNLELEPEQLPHPASTVIDGIAAHPDRQTLIENQVEGIEHRHEDGNEDNASARNRKLKTTPFKKEYELAQQRNADAEERRKAIEKAQMERQQKIEERERFRKAMAKARSGGPNGQRKLGRESKVLLEKVKRMVSNSGLDV